MEDTKPRAPKFRIVFEMSILEADPWSPVGYAELLARIKKVLEQNTDVPCREVIIREVQTIGDQDDYADWRDRRGEYDPANWPKEGRGEIRSEDQS